MKKAIFTNGKFTLPLAKKGNIVNIIIGFPSQKLLRLQVILYF
jgi:hypothetical protein